MITARGLGSKQPHQAGRGLERDGLLRRHGRVARAAQPREDRPLRDERDEAVWPEERPQGVGVLHRVQVALEVRGEGLVEEERRADVAGEVIDEDPRRPLPEDGAALGRECDGEAGLHGGVVDEDGGPLEDGLAGHVNGHLAACGGA